MSDLFRTMKRFGRLKRTGFKRNKFNAVRQNGYDSKMEARAGAELEVLKKGGVIKDYKRQHSVDLIVNGTKVCAWRVDFLVTRADGSQFLYEIKGMPTDAYRLKRNLWVALYGDDVECWVNDERISSVGRKSKWQ
ncbi:MAG TPA: DUF1064 domain-containing protein [Spirochaetota bacterium]|nr:DUF1064 domain-containing protein [Spirochaetota bacterium]